MNQLPGSVSDRAFGFSLAGAFLFIGIIRWVTKGYLSSRLLLVVGLLALIAIVAPSLFLPLNRILRMAINGLLRLMNALILSFAYFVLISPAALVSRFLGRHRHFRDSKDKSRSTYLTQVVGHDDLTSMKDLF
jgi:hypothetical protein